MLSNGRYVLESWGTPEFAGPCAVLRAANITLVVTSRPVLLFDRSLFLAHGCDPRRYDLVVVKSPHCQPHFFDDWAERNFHVDAPGSTSANLPTLGHRHCARPMFPARSCAGIRAGGRALPMRESRYRRGRDPSARMRRTRRSPGPASQQRSNRRVR
jgi:microcystin degradation protein MlrC